VSDVQRDIELLQASDRYASEEEFLEDAFRALLAKRPELRVELAVAKYRDGSVSLNRAAEIAGSSPEQFKETLSDRGIRRDASFLSDADRDEKLADF